MKKFIYLVAIFAFVTLNSIAANSLYFEDDVVVSISQNDLIIISDVAKVMEYAKVKGLSDRAADQVKLASLVEDIEFDNKENFEIKVKTVKESYFKSEVTESVDEVDSLLGSDAADENEKVVSSSMSQYTQAITKFNK